MRSAFLLAEKKNTHNCEVYVRHPVCLSPAPCHSALATVNIIDCEVFAKPTSTETEFTEERTIALAHGACFVARHQELSDVATVQWFWWLCCGSAHERSVCCLKTERYVVYAMSVCDNCMNILYTIVFACGM